jgi:hypothetical protein
MRHALLSSHQTQFQFSWPQATRKDKVCAGKRGISFSRVEKESSIIRGSEW